MDTEALRKALSAAEFEMLIARKGESSAREVHLWGHEAEEIAATIAALREDTERLAKERDDNFRIGQEWYERHRDLVRETAASGGWEVDDDGTNKFVPLTSDGLRLVSGLARQVEELTAELAATRDAWADKYAARGIALDAANTRAEKADVAYRSAEASVDRKMKMVDATSKRLVEMHVAHTVAEVEIDHLRAKLNKCDAWLGETIDQRDAHEERINGIRDALGLDCEWTSSTDVGAECVREIEAMREQLHRVQTSLAEAKGVSHEWVQKVSKVRDDTLQALKKERDEAASACAAMRAEWEVHASDCAVHNEPASPAGPCDCGFKPFPSDIGKDFVSRKVADQAVADLREPAATLLDHIAWLPHSLGDTFDAFCKDLSAAIEASRKP